MTTAKMAWIEIVKVKVASPDIYDYACSTVYLSPGKVGANAACNYWSKPWICAPGTHYEGNVDNGNVEYTAYAWHLHITSAGNRTPGLLILSNNLPIWPNNLTIINCNMTKEIKMCYLALLFGTQGGMSLNDFSLTNQMNIHTSSMAVTYWEKFWITGASKCLVSARTRSHAALRRVSISEPSISRRMYSSGLSSNSSSSAPEHKIYSMSFWSWKQFYIDFSMLLKIHCSHSQKKIRTHMKC